MKHRNWECLRCKCRDFDLGEMHVAGSMLGKIFDVEGTKFTSVTCANCRMTEFYKVDRGDIGNILDLIAT